MTAASAINVGFDVALAKIKAPQRTFPSIDRDDAFDVLVDCLSRRVVIVEAPFGSGKSGFLAEAYYRLGSDKRRFRTAWLTVDEADDDARLHRHALAALHTLWPDLEVDALMEVHRSSPDSSAIALSNFLLEHAAGDDFEYVLLVDDLHEASSEAMERFLNTAAGLLPDNVHVVAAGNHELWESVDVAYQENVRLFPSEKLNFSPHEIEAILSEVARRYARSDSGALDPSLPTISSETIAELADNLWAATAGWPLAVHQYADALSRGRVGFSATVDERSLAKMLSRYFRRGVLDVLPDDLQRFIIDVGLPDEICAELCDALTGRADSKFVLRDLFVQGFFLNPLAGRAGWYEFHSLFRSWLRAKQAQMDPDRLNGLCLVASDWFEANGMECEAAKYLLMASDSNFIEGLASAIGYEVQRSGMTHFEWIGRIPGSEFPKRPYLALQAAWSYLIKGRMHDGWRWIEVFEDAALHAASDDAQAVAMTVALAHEKCLEFDCRYEEAIEVGEQLLESYAGSLSVQQSCLLLHSVGEAHARCGNFDRALKCYLQAEVMAELGGSDLFFVLCQSSIIKLYFAQGKLKEALALCDKALSVSAAVAFSASILASKAHLYVETGRLDEARECIEKACRMVSARYNADVLYEVEAENAHYLSAAGQGAQAFSLIAKTVFQLGDRSIPRSIDLHVYLIQVLVTLSMGYVPEAKQATDALRSRVGAQDTTYQLACAAAEAAVADCSGKPGPSSEVIALVERAREAGLKFYELELSIRAAERLAFEGAHAEAIMYMTSALKLQAGQHIVAPFLRAGSKTRALLHEIVDVRKSGGQVRQLAKAVLRCFGEEDAESSLRGRMMASTAQFDLTEREYEVLDLLNAGLSRREIARTLSISLNTVKSHVTHIYNKLGVTNRIDAFSIANDDE